ncbi:hypothetical protein [Agromyces soli]|uniref:Uncharacterized protein n=1 Tax=Agromyces soli TaxID=659012 RepID=A0ABY4AUH6_9MICO|nr:hypothetical protein [Agromyces soli]UOE25503.1 hypothetical protein MTP13_14345 [Agromyces soli]
MRKPVPAQPLSELIGDRLGSIEFVLNDYMQFRFDGSPGVEESPVLSCFVWPTVEARGRVWREPDLGYADAVRRLAPGTVLEASDSIGAGIRIVLDTGIVRIDPSPDEVVVEIALLRGLSDGGWMVWRPGEDAFAHLA